MTDVEEAVADCSQCLKIVKNLRTRIVSDCTSLVPGDDFSLKYVPPLGDDSNSNALKRKLQLEEERHSVTLSLVQGLRCQLDACKEDLNKAEKDRAAAMVYRTEVDALKQQLSAKEEEVLNLSSELSQRERELRLKGKMKEGSPHGEASCEKGSCADTVTTPLGGQSLAEEMAQVSLSGRLPQQNFLLGARQEVEAVYESKLAELHLKIRSLEQAVKESNHLRILVEDALEDEISHRQSHHTDIPLIHQAVGLQLDIIPGADGAKFAPHSHQSLPSNYLDVSARYRRSHQTLIYILSTVIALIAVVIPYALEPEIPLSGIGYIRPGWARHRNEGEGWQHLWGR